MVCKFFCEWSCYVRLFGSLIANNCNPNDWLKESNKNEDSYVDGYSRIVRSSPPLDQSRMLGIRLLYHSAPCALCESPHWTPPAYHLPILYNAYYTANGTVEHRIALAMASNVDRFRTIKKFQIYLFI